MVGLGAATVDWLVTAAGAVLVLALVRDVFHTLLHSGGQGSLSRLVVRAVWAATNRSGSRRAIPLAGPIGFAAVAAMWTTLLVLGFGLVFWRHLDAAFVATAGQAEPALGFWDAIYFSAVTAGTIGYGDIVAVTPGWRFVAVAEGLAGLALLTAVVSWLLSLYAALQRRRALAGTVSAIAASAPPSDGFLETLASRRGGARRPDTARGRVLLPQP